MQGTRGSVTTDATLRAFPADGELWPCGHVAGVHQGRSSGRAVLGLPGLWGHNGSLWGRLLLAFRANLSAAFQAGGLERGLPFHSLVISLLLKNQALPRSANMSIILLVCLMVI